MDITYIGGIVRVRAVPDVRVNDRNDCSVQKLMIFIFNS